MSDPLQTPDSTPTENRPSNLPGRHRVGAIWQVLFQASTVIGVITLLALLLTVIDQSFGYVALENRIDPDTLAVDGVALQDLPKESLLPILEANISAGLYRRYERELPFAERDRD